MYCCLLRNLLVFRLAKRKNLNYQQTWKSKNIESKDTNKSLDSVIQLIIMSRHSHFAFCKGWTVLRYSEFNGGSHDFNNKVQYMHIKMSFTLNNNDKNGNKSNQNIVTEKNKNCKVHNSENCANEYPNEAQKPICHKMTVKRRNLKTIWDHLRRSPNSHQSRV